MPLRSVLPALFSLILSLPTSACWTMTHTVGRGAGAPYPDVSGATSQRQWFILFGLIPLNQVDPGRMAGNAKDYTVTTQESFIDVVIGLFTGLVTIHPRTVTVTR